MHLKSVPSIDPSLLLKLRLAVALHGEMDGAGRWNTRGVLGRIGKTGLSRGFPSTHYNQDVCSGIASVDFLIERNKQRIALECKANVSRDFDKTVGIARLLLERMKCDRVFIVVPIHGEFGTAAKTEEPAIVVRTAAEAIQELGATNL